MSTPGGGRICGHLTRAGVGWLDLIDRDYVESSNLQRQWLYEEKDAAESLPKAIAAARAIHRINSGVHAEAVVAVPSAPAGSAGRHPTRSKKASPR